jgi:serine/threonine protein kinase
VYLDSSDNQLIGKTLGTCTLQQLLGRGGMGAVYIAQQVRPRRTVAVKVLMHDLHDQSARWSEFLIRFRREADAIAALDHINIMPIYEYGEQDQFAYLVMPYVTGGTLRNVVEKRGILPLEEAITIVEQVAAALDYAHQHGIIHRDLKPGNILFHADGRLLLTDFGIAKVMSEPAAMGAPAMHTLTTTGTIIGTPEYLSPEQATGGPIDQRSDIYSLGIVLFQLLSGHVPFTGPTPVAIAIKHAMEQPPSLSLLNPAIPPDIEHVLEKAIAKKPEQRYATAGDFARALRKAASEAHPFIPQASSALSVTPKEQIEKKVSVSLMSNSTFGETPSASGKQGSIGEVPLTPSSVHEVSSAPTFVSDRKPDAVLSPLTQDKAAADTILAAPVQKQDEPIVSLAQVARRQPGRGSLMALFSGILVLLLIFGGAALYLHWLPAGNRASSGFTRNQLPSTVTSTTKSTAGLTPSVTSVSNAQTALPKPSIPVGKLLFGTPLPLCDTQRSLWETNPSVQVTCDATDTHLTNKNTGQTEGVFLNSLPGNAPIPNDYVLEMQVKPLSASDKAFGVFFRTQSGANHQGGFSFLIQPSGYWNGYIIDDTTGQATSLYGTQEAALTSNGFTTIDIVVQGNTFKLYINGNDQGGISSIHYPTGKLGLALDGGSDILVKNLAIYALP